MTNTKMHLMAAALLAAGVTATSLSAQAQSTPPAPAPAATAAPAAQISQAKRDLLQRLVTLQQPSLENMARSLAHEPAQQMLGAAEHALMTRVPEAKREAVAKQIQGDARKYLEESAAIAKDRAAKLSQTALIPLFDEKFSEDELRQLLVALENPAYKKYQTVIPELSNAFGQKMVADLKPLVDPKLKALEQNVANALGLPLEEPKAPEAKPASKSGSAPKPKKQ